MPRDSSGNYTLPVGNPVVTGTTIESGWCNSTMEDIANALTDSLSRTGQGAMQVPIYFANGTENNPSITFTNAPTYGVWYDSINSQMSLSGGGVKGLSIGAGGEVITQKSFRAEGAIVEHVHAMVAQEINANNGTIQVYPISANTAFTSVLTQGQSVTMMIQYTSGTVTWPAGTIWIGETPVLAPLKMNVVVFWFVDGVLYGTYSGATV